MIEIQHRKLFVTLLVIVIFLLLATLAIILLLRKSKIDNYMNSTGNSPGNMANYGIVCPQGKTTFFLNTNPGNFILSKVLTVLALGKGDRVYYINDNEKKLNQISAPAFTYTGYNLSVIGSKIFYIGFDLSTNLGYSHTGNLYSCGINGKGTKLIAHDASSQYIIYKNSLYCVQESVLFQYDLNGNEIRAVPTGDLNYPDYIELYDDYIYYLLYKISNNGESEYGPIYRMKPDGSARELLINGTVQPGYIVDGGKIYYHLRNSGGVLHVYDLKTHSESTLPVNDSAFNVSNGWVYYADSKNQLYTIKDDGTGNKLLLNSKTVISAINLTQDYVYYCDPENGSSVYRVKKDGTEFRILKP